jgi:DNA-binding transcriptional regulator GbsR (MarR family)
MNPAIERFIERMGLEAEADGLPRIAGRVLGFLITAQAPSPLDELADCLQVSRASVSTNCRLLEQIGAAERVSLPGDRKDYYQLASGFPQRFIEVTQTRLDQKVTLAREALRDLPIEEADARERMARWLEFHAFIRDELDGIAERWQARSLASDSTTADAR